jgi:signal transduction histidine kinase
MLQVAARNIDRLSRLVDTLMDVSRVEAGKVSIPFSISDVPSVVFTALTGSSSLSCSSTETSRFDLWERTRPISQAYSGLCPAFFDRFSVEASAELICPSAVQVCDRSRGHRVQRPVRGRESVARLRRPRPLGEDCPEPFIERIQVLVRLLLVLF